MKGVILDGDSLGPKDLDLNQLLNCIDEWQVYPVTTPEQTAERIQHADIVISNKVLLSEKELNQAKQLKLIMVAATGTNNIDLTYAKQQNITVCNVVNYGSATVAQHALTLLLVLSTRLLDYVDDVKNNQWQQSPFFCLMNHPIQELAGKKCGIVGYGELGKAFSKLVEALGMEVLIAERPGGSSASDPAFSKGSSSKKVQRYPLIDILPQVDVLSLHCPLTPATENVLNRETLALMKPSALLINTARGGIVDEHALVAAIKNKTIAGAGFDVLKQEPPQNDSPLLQAMQQEVGNIIVTPHCAWASQEARQRLVDQMVGTIVGFVDGKPRHVVGG